MNQRGFSLTVYLIAAAVLAAAFLGYGQYRYSQGVDKERSRNLNAVIEKEVEMSTLRRTHAREIEAVQKQSAAISEAANKKIRELLQTNKALSDWWNTAIPPDAADFAWVQPPVDNAVLGRSGLVKTDTSSSEAREPNRR